MEYLPETLIHRVQSFLTGKEATQTTLLSKSWRAAWSTRPTIHLDESHFPDPPFYDEIYNTEIDGFTCLAKKTFRRYEESNLGIDTFFLCLETGSYAQIGLAAEWILKALKLGATDLTFRFRNRYTRSKEYFDIPHTAVVFGYENVQRICLHCLQIDGLKVINCTRLKSLTLVDFRLETDQFCGIISCLPLIEYLSLSDVHSSSSNNNSINKKLIEYLSFSDVHSSRSNNNQKKKKKKVVRSPPTIILFKLRTLVLSGFESQLQMKRLFLDDLSSKFLNLKDLTLGLISPYDKSYKPAEVIRNISSGTLETLNLRYVENIDMNNENIGNGGEKIARVKLDVPSVRKFTFEGSFVPKLCFSPTPAGDQWDSHVLIRNCGDLSTKWFYELSELLTKLKGSKVHLCLRLNFSRGFDYEVGGMDGLNVFEVDDLTLDTKDVPSMSCYAFLDALFRSCHPKMITQCVRPPLNDDEVYHRKIYPTSSYHEDRANSRNNDLFICRSIERALQVKSVLLPTHFMYGLRDLEELDAQQLFDEVWKPQPLSSVLDDSTSEKRRFRLRLKWKSPLIPYMGRPEGDDDNDVDDDVDVEVEVDEDDDRSYVDDDDRSYVHDDDDDDDMPYVDDDDDM